MSPATPPDEALRTFLAAGNLNQAAERCLELGNARRASALFEQACAFAEASDAATRGGDWRGAARLAAFAADDALVVRALDKLVTESSDEARKEGVALTLRGQHRYAAWVFDRIEDMGATASAYERAELPLAAAHAHVRAGQIAKAARLLECAIQEAGDVGGNSYRVALGELYAVHGKHEAAANHLQAVPGDAPERPRALELLCSSLDALGLRDGIAALEAEWKSLGGHESGGAHGAALGFTDSQAKAGSVAVTVFGRYRVLREVAVTPHARLLHAIDELSGEEVAVKWLAATGSSRGRDALARFVREAQALAELRHPAIVDLRDYIERGPAMVLEWMSGGGLDDLLVRQTFAPARAAQVASSVLAALGVAHRMGILHRDVKPANLLFDGLGAVHLADFGAAHWSASQATVTQGVIGTLAYMAPEQRRGEPAS
ncbi:MAG: serine/threonine-protein kinase, partial [Polyangiaceae bacterium]